ncbi:MAG: response regulator [Bacilli bacterium]|nr:response regulator [Bacilli bacterium]
MNDVNYLKNNGVDVDKSLELFGDLETYNSSLSDFINDVSEKIDKLRSFKEIGDMANYSIDVHSIKSDAKYFGFNKLADIALEHEMKSKENNMFYISQHYDELEQEMNNALRIAKVYLGNESIDDIKEIKQDVNTPKEKTILIVDDSEVIKSFIEKLFNNEYEILVASDGMEAINIIKEGKYHNLVGMFLDLNMPNVNGFQVLDFFKENNLFEKIPVSIITGVGSDDLVARAYEYPIIDVLRKPFNEKNIRLVVNKTVNKNFENFE